MSNEIPPQRLSIHRRENGQKNFDRVAQLLEPVLIFLCFAFYAGQLPPDVNESHYLTKAKHFWDPNWSPGDIFLGSSFSHWLFYVAAGWLTKFMSLSAVAWAGRILTWGLLAFAWRRLSWRLLRFRWVSIVSAIFFLLLNDRFHLAGEWVVGGFEAKGFAYFFVLMALGSVADGDWKWAWPFLGAAAAFHVLVGGWAMLAMIFAWLILASTHDKYAGATFDQFKNQSIPFLAGIALTLMGAIPPLLADQSASTEISVAARSIYVNHRIAHHLTFDAFPSLNVARFVGIAVFWLISSVWLANRWSSLFRRIRPLNLFCFGSLAISFGGLLLSGLAEQNGSLAITSEGLLRFYWFRLADFAIPMMGAFTGSAVLCFLLISNPKKTTRLSCFIVVSCLVAATGVTVLERFQDERPRADRSALPMYENDPVRTMETYRNWRKVCQWVAENTPADSTFITPHEQQTFKWYAGRAEVVSWKDVPQDANGILEWNQRLRELYDPQRRYLAGLMSYSDEQLRGFAKQYGADYLIVPQRHVDQAAVPTELRQVYPTDVKTKSTYVVFEF